MNYKITQEQFEQIQFFKNMFDNISDNISGIALNEKPDIVYGFELGKLHNHVRLHFMDMMKLVEEIKEQKL